MVLTKERIKNSSNKKKKQNSTKLKIKMLLLTKGFVCIYKRAKETFLFAKLVHLTFKFLRLLIRVGILQKRVIR